MPLQQRWCLTTRCLRERSTPRTPPLFIHTCQASQHPRLSVWVAGIRICVTVSRCRPTSTIVLLWLLLALQLVPASTAQHNTKRVTHLFSVHQTVPTTTVPPLPFCRYVPVVLAIKICVPIIALVMTSVWLC